MHPFLHTYMHTYTPLYIHTYIYVICVYTCTHGVHTYVHYVALCSVTLQGMTSTLDARDDSKNMYTSSQEQIPLRRNNASFPSLANLQSR